MTQLTEPLPSPYSHPQSPADCPLKQTTNNRKLLLQLFFTFFKIGPVTFGGGYAMIPFIEREIVERRGWVTSEDIVDVFAVAESVPGAIAINSATFVGYKIAKVKGALAAMLGMLLPTFIIVLLLSMVYSLVQHNPIIEAAFMGIRPAIVALIFYAALKIGRTAVIDKTTMAVAMGTVLLLLFVHLNPLLVIASGALVGIALVTIKRRLGIMVHFDKQGDNS